MLELAENRILAATLIIAFGFFSSVGIVVADDASTSVTVGNAAPTVSNVDINSATAITLNENTTTTATTTVTVTDTNGCSDISSVVADLYLQSGVGAATCDTIGEANDNNCYPRVTCNVVTSGNTCGGGVDTSADYTCVFDLQFFATPTDAGAPQAADIWEATVTADDGTDTATNTDTEEINSLSSLNVTASIGYGTLAAADDTGTTNSTTTVTNTGNRSLDADISGVDMTDGGVNTIAASQQKYDTSSVTYASLTFSLSNTPTTRTLDLAKPTSVTAVTDDLYWGIAIPGGQTAASYTGTNTFTANADD